MDRSSRGFVAGLPRLLLVIMIGYIAGSVQSMSSWRAGLTTALQFLRSPMEISTGALVLGLLAVGLYVLQSLLPNKRKVFVLDFAVHNPHPSWRFPRAQLRKLCEKRGRFTAEDLDFQEKIAFRTGLGDDTAVVPAIQAGRDEALGMEPARFEFAATCFPTIQEVLDKAGVGADQINFVITNSSLFNPTPSLSAMIVNHFKMGKKTIGYSLGGMGCSAGIIALDLARELLELHPNSYALVVSHENITNNFYVGNDRSMLIPNVLFRANGSAVLLSNKRRDANRSKYCIRNIVRTHLASDDVAYNCVIQMEDADGNVGVRLNKDLISVGARALRTNMTDLGPLVLPLSEQLAYAANAALRKAVKLCKPVGSAVPQEWLQPYTPDFRKAFDFFCIHTGGRGIIDGLEKEMHLTRRQVEPSRASLYRFGNTSSTSVWYELAYIESRAAGLARGQRVWQLAFGSGFKFNSCVLVANKRVQETHTAWKGFDSEAMWRELDALDAQVSAERAARAKLQGEKVASH